MWKLSGQNISRQIIDGNYFKPKYLPIKNNWSKSDSNPGPLPFQV